DGQTAARETWDGSDCARSAFGSHGCAAQAETFSGSGAYGDLSDRRFYRDDRRPDGALGDAASAEPRAGGGECGDLQGAGIQDSRSEENGNRFQPAVDGRVHVGRLRAADGEVYSFTDARARGVP